VPVYNKDHKLLGYTVEGSMWTPKGIKVLLYVTYLAEDYFDDVCSKIHEG